jgi:CRP-like cAMP-binding protein
MPETKENLLLAALPREERERLDPFLEWAEFELEDTLIEPDEPIKYVFFPFDCVTSTIQELTDGSSIETGLMGVEGMIGIQLWLQMPSTPTRTLAQVPGHGHRMSAEDFIREVRDNPASPLNDLIARYTHAFLSMTSIGAACNRLHTLDQRMCRWLKLTHNRIRRDEFPMRQEFLAQMLGVQRPTVSTTAHMLQQAGLITYTRGRMRVLDPEGLVDGSCECYELMERQMDRIFDVPWRKLAKEEDEKGGRVGLRD